MCCLSGQEEKCQRWCASGTECHQIMIQAMEMYLVCQTEDYDVKIPSVFSCVWMSQSELWTYFFTCHIVNYAREASVFRTLLFSWHISMWTYLCVCNSSVLKKDPDVLHCWHYLYSDYCYYYYFYLFLTFCCDQWWFWGLIYLGSQRRIAVGKATTNSLDKVFKSKDISLPMKTLIFTFFFLHGDL